MENKKTFDFFTSLIDQAFNKAFSGEPEEPVVEELETDQPLYESIEDYTAKTGKRFRMTKTQKELGMTREEAFTLQFKN